MSIPVSDRQRSIRSLNNLGSILSSVVLASALARPVEAKTYFDTDVYGDKELKIATVNKMKQKLRNAILQDINVAGCLLKCAINDALGYEVATESGGPNGSILFEKDREENKNLKKAIDVIATVKKELLRTNTVSAADVCSFAGAEALETVGCPRVVVQVGRADAKSADPKTSVVNWPSEATIADLADSPPVSPADFRTATLEAFKSSGLQVQDIVLILGGLGEINRIVAETNKDKADAAAKGSGEEEDEDFEPQPFVPSSFGARDAMYGAKMGKADFGGKYFQALLKGKGGKGDLLGKILMEDAAMKALVQKYATNEPAFKAEIGDAYLKMTLLGASYTTRNS